MDKPVCAVLGVGPGNGAAIARAFAGAGHAVALLARRVSFIDELASELSGSMALACDIGRPDELAQALDRVTATLGPVDTLVYNGGRGAFGPIDAVSSPGLRLWDSLLSRRATRPARGTDCAARAARTLARPLAGAGLAG